MRRLEPLLTLLTRDRFRKRNPDSVQLLSKITISSKIIEPCDPVHMAGASSSTRVEVAQQLTDSAGYINKAFTPAKQPPQYLLAPDQQRQQTKQKNNASSQSSTLASLTDNVVSEPLTHLFARPLHLDPL